MKNLFYKFMREKNIQAVFLHEMSPQKLSIQFNSWLTKLGQRNEANKFMIRKWIVNGTFN